MTAFTQREAGHQLHIVAVYFDQAFMNIDRNLHDVGLELAVYGGSQTWLALDQTGEAYLGFPGSESEVWDRG